MRDGGWLAEGKSCGRSDKAAGDNGILSGTGGETFFSFSMVGQQPGEGMTSEGYRFRLLVEPTDSLGDVDRVLMSWYLMGGAIP